MTIKRSGIQCGALLEPKRATAKGSSCSAGDVKEAHVSAYVHPSGARMDPRDVARTGHEVSAHQPLGCCLLELGCCWGCREGVLLTQVTALGEVGWG